MAAINVDKMSLKDLLDLEARVKKAIVSAKEREKAEARREAMAALEKRGFTMAEIFGAPRGGKSGGKVAVKYRNPDNPADTWTGRGRQPKWLVAALKKGAKITDFAL